MKKKYWIPLLILLIIIGIRIALPFWIVDFANKKLDELGEYRGSIEDVDLNLFRGAFRIDSLEIDKIEANNNVPFVAIDHIDVSVEWSAIFNGAFVGEVWLINPVVNFVAPNQDDGEFGTEINWPQKAKELLPITINRFVVQNGTLHYYDFASDPQIDLPVTNLELEVLNITNATKTEDRLPTYIELYATSIGGGYLSFVADADLIKNIPEVDATMEFEDIDVTDLNNFLEAYAGVDAEGGTFNLYSEIIIKEGMLSGYVKPIIDGLKVVDLDDSDDNVLQKAWEGIVGVVTEVFENQKEDQFATEVPLEGDLNNIETGVFTAVWNIFRNAFVEAFSKSAGGQIEFEEQ